FCRASLLASPVTLAKFDRRAKRPLKFECFCLLVKASVKNMSACNLPLVDQSGWEASRISNLPAAAVVTTRSVKFNICSYIDTIRSTSTLRDEGTVTQEAYLSPIEDSGLAARITDLEGQKEADETHVMERAERTANPPAEDNRTTTNTETVVVPPSHDRTTIKEVVIHYPVDGLLCKPCNTLFPNVSLFAKHRRRSHQTKTFRTKCSRCQKTGEFHSIACHYPKCKGLLQTVMGEFQREVCEANFTTKSGLGQHERHMHPVLRNNKHIEADKPTAKRRKGLCSEEEEILLEQLEISLAGARFINVEIAKVLTTKTAKQISDKRRLLQKKRLTQVTAQTTPKTSEREEHETIQEEENGSAAPEVQQFPYKIPAKLPKHREVDEQIR
ncbi:hypothetical protein chiPu_0022478, partial [Chiloscyllium punctatum]|nr:hypothetical protein [Chiloscyllium punctatum]